LGSIRHVIRQEGEIIWLVLSILPDADLLLTSTS
jgi:hypothetical protein